MRSIAFFVEMLVLLPIATIRPFAGVLLWSWVSFMSPHKLLWGPASSLPWAMAIIVVTLIGCLSAREPKSFSLNPVTGCVVLFMICITMTSLTAMAPASEVYQKWNIIIKSMSVLLLTSWLLTTKERIHALVWVMVLCLAYFGMKGGGFTIMHGGSNRVEGPPDTMIGDNNALAAGLLITIPLMNYLRMHSEHRIIRLGFATVMVLTLFSVVGSYSRGALLGLFAVTVFLWFKSKAKVVSAMVLPLLVGSIIAFMPADWMARMQTLTDAESTSSGETRMAIWNVAWQMAVHRPLTGTGFMGPYYDEIARQFVPGAVGRAVHSIWFEVLGEHGFVTFFIWVAITVFGVIATRRTIKAANGVPGLEWCVDLSKMIQVSIIGYLVAGSFLSLSYWDFYFTILVVAAATHQYVRQALGETDTALRRPVAAGSRTAVVSIARRQA
ncbi:MAG TPA: putative O-glycosylation ligase, exosortase A system-associated [Acetobacteraceae bacterium]|jgi:putative inorganic carbon (HCO3(-)) transporter|nr:putative O-glycosylation ligase, exosortase A system-associated [Acetobacteraceae bacterium]